VIVQIKGGNTNDSIFGHDHGSSCYLHGYRFNLSGAFLGKNMYHNIWLFIIFIGAVVLITKPLGLYIYNVFHGRKTCLDWFALPMEKSYSKLVGVTLKKEQTAKEYLLSLLVFSLFALLFVLVILMVQALLPWW
jgi:hypothetical protein